MCAKILTYFLWADDVRSPWTCKNCDTYNFVPEYPDSMLECPECIEGTKKCGVGSWGSICCYHRGFPLKNDRCKKCNFECEFSRKFLGTPGRIWRTNREEYKKAIMCDVPGHIPEDVAPHLITEAERLMYKQARRAIQLCIDNDVYDSNWTHPKRLMKDLECLKNSKITHRAMKSNKNMSIIGECLFEACMNLGDMKYLDIGHTLYHMSEIDADLDMYETHYEERRAYREQRLEMIKNDPDTAEVQGSKGELYLTNKEGNFCTCLGFKYYGECKHLRKKIFHKKP
jgi:hypothetical protein